MINYLFSGAKLSRNTAAVSNMRPAGGSNAAGLQTLEKLRNYNQYWVYLRVLTINIFFLILIIRAARPGIQAHAARETL